MDTVLSQKCAAVLDVRLGSDVKMLETLALLSSLTDNDDSKTQHMTTLRSSIEASSLAAAKEFVAILKTVESEVSTLSSAISKIHSTTALISESITAAETAATLSPNSPAALIANAVKARDSAIDSQKALTAFKTRFQLANDTTAKLQFDFEALPPNEPIPQDGYDFLEALATVNAVKESLVTASRTTANDLVGKDLLPMLETLSTRHTIAQNKLYSFLQAFLHLDSSPNATAAQLDAAYADPFTPTAINLLTPAFQFHVVEMVGQARRLMLATTFLTALTSKGGEGIGGMSHDPVGYVGNIAAWVHQAVAAEQETLEFCFSALPPLPPPSLLSQSLSGLARPLKSRITRVVDNLGFSNDDALDGDEGAARYKLLSLYAVCGVLLFYRRQLGAAGAEEESGLVAAIDECLVKARDTYKESLQAHGESLKHYVAASEKSQSRLGSDTIASLAVAAITELKETRDASPGFATEVDDAFSHDTVLSAILNPALQLVNTVDELTVLKGGSVGEKWDKAIEDKIERLLSAAIEVQVGAILESLGIKDVDAGNARGAFETFNAKMVDFAAPTFDEINQTKARMTARRRVLERIVEEYGRVWSEFGEAGKAVHSPDALRQILN